MEITKAERAFKYNAIDLKDPDPALSTEEVREFYSKVYPEILSAAIEGPEITAGKMVYTFRRAVGTKGAAEKFRLTVKCDGPSPRNATFTDGNGRLLSGVKRFMIDVGARDEFIKGQIEFVPLADLSLEELEAVCSHEQLAQLAAGLGYELVKIEGGDASPPVESPARNLPLSCEVQGEVLTIQMGIDTLAFAAVENDRYFDHVRNDSRLTIDNKSAFAKAVVREINKESENSGTPLTRVIDDAIHEALEWGVDGCELAELAASV